MILQGKKIIVGITGGIAAYKIPLLVRLLVKQGAEVKCIMTESAKQFVTAETLSVLSKNPVLADFFDENQNWNNHVELGLWADLMLIAPCTANTLSKLAEGKCDSLLMAIYLSLRCEAMIAPAMDEDMYAHPTTLENINKLVAHKNIVIPADSGELASGLNGQGRLPEPEALLVHVISYFESKAPLRGKKIMISAGPTYEAIDPVRFIGNHSSGKMGIAIANVAAKLGAQVTLIAGPIHKSAIQKGIQVIDVMSAKDMLDACLANYEDKHVIIKAAAVADYTPTEVAKEKIKKNDTEFTIHLKKTTDILGTLGGLKKAHQLLVGFALETNDELNYAQGKLSKKNCDMIVLNSLNNAGAGFKHDTNQITLVEPNNKITNFELLPKDQVAQVIMNRIIDLLKEKENQ